MLNEFKYRQTWKIWPSPISLSLYSTFKLQPDKMVKQTQTIRRQFANELFEYVWPFCEVGASKVNLHLAYLKITKFLHLETSFGIIIFYWRKLLSKTWVKTTFEMTNDRLYSFYWDSLHARLNGHKAWSSKKKDTKMKSI